MINIKLPLIDPKAHLKPSLASAQLANYVFISSLPLVLGFGVYPLLIPAALIALIALFFIEPTPFLKNIQRGLTQLGYLALLFCLGLFLASYRGFYVPYHPEILKMPWAYFGVLFTLSMFTLLWIGLFTSTKEHILFIWFFSLGALFLVLGTVGAALALQPPPYYGNIIDIRYLPFGITKLINTPGMANLLCLFPIIFLAGILLEPSQRPRWFWVVGMIGLVLSVAAAIALNQRSYFVIALFIEPIVVGLCLLLLKLWRPFFAILSVLAIYPILLGLDHFLGTGFLYRPLDKSLIIDARFQMLEFWFTHLLENPFQLIEVGPAPWSELQWFHNFFADIHRLSGFWALLAAVVLIVFIFYRLICVIRINRRFGLFLMAIAIPCFLIMNTSVVPEGERQPFLLLLAIGAICEVTISRARKILKRHTHNPLSGSQ